MELVMNKTLKKVISNKGINGFPAAMQPLGALYVNGDDEKVTDRMVDGEKLFFYEGDIKSKLQEYNKDIHNNIPRYFKTIPIGMGLESQMNDIIIYNKKFYIATQDGVAVSEDGIKYQWKKPDGIQIKQCLRIYQYDDKLYTITSDGRLYKSDDLFETVTEIDLSIYSGEVVSQLIRPITSLYIKGDLIVVGTKTKGLFVSTNPPDGQGRRTWINKVKIKIPQSATFSYNGTPPPEGEPIPEDKNIDFFITDPNSMTSDTIFDIGIWGDKCIIATSNGFVSTLDFQSFTHHIFRDQEPKPISYTGWEVKLTPIAFHKVRYNKDKSTIISYNDGFYENDANNTFFSFIPSFRSDGSTAITPAPAPLEIYTPTKTDENPYNKQIIRDLIYLDNNIWCLIEGGIIYISYDNRSSWFQKPPSSGFQGSTPASMVYGPDVKKLIIISDKSIITPIDADIKVYITTVKKLEESVPHKIQEPMSYGDFVSKVSNLDPPLSDALKYENDAANYIIMLIKTPLEKADEFHKIWYIIGQEKRFNDIKDVAAAFGVS